MTLGILEIVCRPWDTLPRCSLAPSLYDDMSMVNMLVVNKIVIYLIG
jgi:hypothetical protein